jgi:hypothetical protein
VLSKRQEVKNPPDNSDGLRYFRLLHIISILPESKCHNDDDVIDYYSLEGKDRFIEKEKCKFIVMMIFFGQQM